MNASNEMRSKVKAVLLRDWDPIGVGDVTQARDEYDSYLLPIIELISSRRSPAELADYLLRIETDKIGLPGDAPRARRVAETLYALKSGSGAAE